MLGGGGGVASSIELNWLSEKEKKQRWNNFKCLQRCAQSSM
jgi:hypothetical protein